MAPEKGQLDLAFIFKGMLCFCVGLLVSVWFMHIMLESQGSDIASSFIGQAATAVVGAGCGLFCTLAFFVYSAIRRHKSKKDNS